MLNISQYLANHTLEMDAFGRIQITDPFFIKKLNQQSHNSPRFNVPDAACGNDNCWC